MMRQTDEILDRIYQATLEPVRWPDVLGRICAASGFTSGCLIVHDPGAATPVFYATARTEQALSDFIDAGYFASCARRLVRVGRGRFAHESDFPAAAAQRPAVETLRRLGLWDQTATQHFADDGRRLVFTFEREANAPGFSRGAVKALNRLRPHLVRSAAMGVPRAGRGPFRSAGGVSALLEAISDPAMLVEGGLRVIEANDAALAVRPPLLDRSGAALRPDQWQDTDALLAWLGDNAQRMRPADRVIRPCDQRMAARRLQSFPARWGEAAAQLLILGACDPARRDTARILPNQSSFVAAAPVWKTAHDMAEANEILADEARELMRRLGLTRREAELAALMVRGLSLAEAATQLAISRETARHHLKQLFQKTETHRQGQLVALIARG